MDKPNETNEIKKDAPAVVPPVKEDRPLNKTQLRAIELGMVKEDVLKLKDPTLLKSIVSTLEANKIVNTPEDPAASDTSEIPTPPVYVETPLEIKLDNERWFSKKQKQKKYFDSQPKVAIMIPLEAGEKVGVVQTKLVKGIEETIVISGAVWSKTFNGFRVVVPKGVYTQVPADVAQNIADELNQTLTAGEAWKIDRIDPNTGKSVREQL